MNPNHRLFPVCLIALLFALPAAATESVTYEGRMGFSQGFSLIGGQYTLYVNAHYATEWTRRNNCVFGADLQRVAPTHDSVEIGSPCPSLARSTSTSAPSRFRWQRERMNSM